MLYAQYSVQSSIMNGVRAVQRTIIYHECCTRSTAYRINYVTRSDKKVNKIMWCVCQCVCVSVCVSVSVCVTLTVIEIMNRRWVPLGQTKPVTG